MKSQNVFNEINITPLTDIFLVLLIIMMVVAPMMQQTRADIKPPQVQNGSPVKQGLATVEVTASGQYYIEGAETPVTGLKDALQQRAAALSEKNVMIRADKTTKSGAVMKVLEAARDAGYAKVTVAGENLSTERQRTLTEGGAE